MQNKFLFTNLPKYSTVQKEKKTLTKICGNLTSKQQHDKVSWRKNYKYNKYKNVHKQAGLWIRNDLFRIRLRIRIRLLRRFRLRLRMPPLPRSRRLLCAVKTLRRRRSCCCRTATENRRQERSRSPPWCEQRWDCDRGGAEAGRRRRGGAAPGACRKATRRRLRFLRRHNSALPRRCTNNNLNKK